MKKVVVKRISEFKKELNVKLNPGKFTLNVIYHKNGQHPQHCLA